MSGVATFAVLVGWALFALGWRNMQQAERESMAFGLCMMGGVISIVALVVVAASGGFPWSLAEVLP